MLTRCPACSTVFRLDTVQLRAREGRVRCGRCHTVFDAVDAMVELPLPKPVSAAAAIPAGPPAPSPSVPPAPEPSPDPGPAPDPVVEDSHATLNIVDALDLVPPPSEPAAVTTRHLDDDAADAPPLPHPGDTMDALVERSTDHFEQSLRHTADVVDDLPATQDDADASGTPGQAADSETDTDPDVTQPLDLVELEASLPHDSDAGGAITGDGEDSATGAGADSTAAVPHDTVSTVARDPLLDPPPALEPVSDPAVQRIRRELYGEDGTHRRSAVATAAWTIGSLLLLLLAAAQLTYTFRTDLAVAQPALKPVLEAACARIGCTVPAPRRADLISIESSELNPDKARAPLLRLNALLRNGAAFAQDWPHLELTLTDTADRAVVRRVLAPTDYLPASRGDSPSSDAFPAQFAGRSEQPVSLLVDPTDTGAGGYRLYVFYP